MLPKLLGFQEDAVNEILEKSRNSRQGKKGIIINSPTGSGKTIILLDYIDKWISLFPKQYVFVWFCPGAGDLEEQSRTVMENTLKHRTALNLDEAILQGFSGDDTVFINWEQVNKKGNKAMTECEHRNLLDRIKKAHRNQLKFIIIVDEEHTYNTPTSKAVINEFSADYMVRVSATAKKDNRFDWYNIDEIDVINAELITKALYINEGIEPNYRIEDENQLLLELADNKRKEIRQAYKDINKDINPLVLIQFPDKSESLIRTIEQKLEAMGYTYKNGTVAKWLSDQSDKINLDKIADNSAMQDFLLIKQAVATGWNCKRAKILIKLRENMSETFEIQTVGRIRRMPEAKHYGVEVLDNCYLYTFDEKFKQSVKASIISAFDVKHIKLKEKCKTFSLIKENKDENSEGLGSKEAFNILKGYLIKKYKLLAPTKNKEILERNGYRMDKDVIINAATGKYITTSEMRENESFAVKSKVNTNNHGLELRQTVDMLKNCIHTDYDTCSTVLRRLFLKDEKPGAIVSLSLSDYYAFIINNRYILKNDLDDACAEVMVDPVMKFEPRKSTFKLPEIELLEYSSGVENVVQLLTSAYEDYTSDCLVDGIRSKPERLFERYCEKNKDVEWVYKNGDKGLQYLSIVYIEGFNNQFLFYPDYIVKLKSGDIWIIETKGGESKSGQDQNYDKQIKNKFKAFKRYAEENKLNFGFVRHKEINDEYQLFLNNTEYQKEISSSEWVKLSDVF